MHAGVRQRIHLIHHERRYLLPACHIIGPVELLTLKSASEKCQQEKRKTVNGEDILFAMTSLGFENYGEALKIYLARYREVSLNPATRAPYYYYRIFTNITQEFGRSRRASKARGKRQWNWRKFRNITLRRRQPQHPQQSHGSICGSWQRVRLRAQCC